MFTLVHQWADEMTKFAIRMSELLWATRGKTWGFRVLMAPGEWSSTPMLLYQSVFNANRVSMTWSEGSILGTWETLGSETCSILAARFTDPDPGAVDEAGRPISHEFIALVSCRKNMLLGLPYKWYLDVFKALERSYRAVYEDPECRSIAAPNGEITFALLDGAHEALAEGRLIDLGVIGPSVLSAQPPKRSRRLPVLIALACVLVLSIGAVISWCRFRTKEQDVTPGDVAEERMPLLETQGNLAPSDVPPADATTTGYEP